MMYIKCTARVLKVVCELGRETINTPMYVQMDASECHVMTDNLARYTLTGEPRTPTSRAVKILRLAAFAPHVPTSVDFNLRVYFVEDTQDALEVRVSSLYDMIALYQIKSNQIYFSVAGNNNTQYKSIDLKIRHSATEGMDGQTDIN